MFSNKLDTFESSYFADVLNFKSLLSLLRCNATMIQLLSNKITPHFQLLPMSKVDQSYLRIYEVPPLQ